jgi:mono/diheme cytochrome c family protein
MLKGVNGPIKVSGVAYNSVMPPHDFLSDKEIASVLTYIRNNFGNTSSLITEAEVRAERAKLPPQKN